MDEVLDADDAVAPEGVLDQVVGGDGSPLSVDLDEKMHYYTRCSSYRIKPILIL